MKYLIGIQPTAPKLHIGNYLGCIKEGIDLQKSGANVEFMIADKHAILSGMPPDEVNKNSFYLKIQLEVLGAQKGTVKLQDEKTPEIFIKLLGKTSVAQLKKLPQYKEKAVDYIYDVGLLTYPVLMAADIYQALRSGDTVITGPDQKPHIDFANDLLAKVYDGFRVQNQLTSFGKIGSLRAPQYKMSKSSDPNGVLWMFESSEEAYMTSLRPAITTPEGVENLIKIYQGITNNPEIAIPNSKFELKQLIAKQLHELCQKP